MHTTVSDLFFPHLSHGGFFSMICIDWLLYSARQLCCKPVLHGSGPLGALLSAVHREGELVRAFKKGSALHPKSLPLAVPSGQQCWFVNTDGGEGRGWYMSRKFVVWCPYVKNIHFVRYVCVHLGNDAGCHVNKTRCIFFYCIVLPTDLWCTF